MFTICFTIINIVIFVQPWLGDPDDQGYFGLFESCKYQNIYISSSNQHPSYESSQQQGSRVNDDVNFYNQNPYELHLTTTTTVAPSVVSTSSYHYFTPPVINHDYRFLCDGDWRILSKALNPTATFSIGFSALLNLLCIACFLVLFLFVSPMIVFTICGVLQLLSAFFMFLGCVVYPNNWGEPRVVNICYNSSSYFSGKCRIKWAYILAIIGIFDILLLGILALVLSRRQAPNYKIATAVNLVDTNVQNVIVASPSAVSVSGMGGGGAPLALHPVEMVNDAYTCDHFHHMPSVNHIYQSDDYMDSRLHHHHHHYHPQHHETNSFRDFQI